LKIELTAEIVRELLHYDPDTGVLTWRYRYRKWFKRDQDFLTWNKRWAYKKIAENKKLQYGYKVTKIFSEGYFVHRIIWLYMTGNWPNQIDHKNHDRSDNKWFNLRDVNHKENHRNRTLQNNNTSGHSGVTWYPNYNKWLSRIKYNNKVIYLGYFNNKSNAIKARKAAEIKYGFHKNHGT